jgi:hypothetical protein
MIINARYDYGYILAENDDTGHFAKNAYLCPAIQQSDSNKLFTPYTQPLVYND